MTTAAPTATGRVIQITGPVVDIEFPPGQLPAILNAVEIEREGSDPLVCEVQQHLGNNWVRSVAMKNATENAEDLIDDLTLSYNKVRQTNITREMIEIASGANAR